MTRMTLNKSLFDTVQEYKDKPYRYITQTLTWDGLDRTWQSSGADDERINSHDQALATLKVLIDKVETADLPFQWLLDLSIIVESYDRTTRRAQTDHWAVVFVPEVATSRLDLTYTNHHGLGFQVVHYSGHTVALPAHNALDKDN